MTDYLTDQPAICLADEACIVADYPTHQQSSNNKALPDLIEIWQQL
jgi:hypothetical protein